MSVRASLTCYTRVKSNKNIWWKLKVTTKILLTEQSLTGRSSLGKLINWMYFFVLKPLNWFFQFSWKEKTCLLSAVSIWHESLEEIIYICTQKLFFRVFHRFLRNSLRGPKKYQKTQCKSQYDIFLRDFILDVRRR